MEVTIKHQNPFKKKSNKSENKSFVTLNLDSQINIKTLRNSILMEKKNLNIKCRSSKTLPTIYKLYTLDSKKNKIVPLYQYKSNVVDGKKKKSTVLLNEILSKNDPTIYVFKGKYNYRLYYNENPQLTKLYGGNYKGYNASQAANKAYNRTVKIMQMNEKDMTEKQKMIYSLLKKNYKKKDNNLNFSLIHKDKVYDFKCNQVEMKSPVKYIIYPAETPKNKKLDREQVQSTTVEKLKEINPMFKLREIAHKNNLVLLR